MSLSIRWVAEPSLLIKEELPLAVRKPLLYLTMPSLVVSLGWSQVIDTRAAHEMVWAHWGKAGMGKRKGTQPRAALLAWHLRSSGCCHNTDPGTDHSWLIFYWQSRTGEVFRPKKECMSLLKWYMSQHKIFRDHMYKSKQICPTCAPTSLQEEGTNVELWRLQRKSCSFQTAQQLGGKRAAGCECSETHSVIPPKWSSVHPEIIPDTPKTVCSKYQRILCHGRLIANLSMPMCRKHFIH